MHEMSLAESVREIVEETARASGAHRVRRVRLEIGALSQVEPEAMRFGFELVMRGSLAESAALEIVQTPGTAWCMKCSQAVTIERRGDACPCCGSLQLQVTGGERMRVMDIEID
jgi:hydrogenase nickel incorporation protein HypA/HybF